MADTFRLEVLPRLGAAPEGAARDLERTGDHAPRLPRCSPSADVLEIEIPGWPAESNALGAGPGQPGAHALPQALALLPGDPGEDGDEQIPNGPAGVEPGLLVAHHADAPHAELFEVSGRHADALATQAVQGPDQEHAELAPVGTSENCGQ